MLRRARSRLGAAAVLVLASTALTVPTGQAATPLTVPQGEVDAIRTAKGATTHLVLLDGDPVASYDGGEPGLRATAPRDGRKLNPNSRAVREYRAHLLERAGEALQRAGVTPDAIVYEYGYTFNGIAVQLTAGQAAALRSDPAVTAVFEDEVRQLTTDSTPGFLGLTGEDGVWDGAGLRGEGVVVGVIDSGIWPENPAFADDTQGRSERSGQQGRPEWFGTCDGGQQFSASRDCNEKLIGARYYSAGYFGPGASVADVRREFPQEYLSPRDADGHGTHTASTAAGNADVATPFGRISGIAPEARVAAYKVCWGYSGQGGCSSVDSVAAIDQAVADGVDVINFSISGTASNYLDPVEVAFLFAADAGVVVNASAGNAGPGPATANHPSPWITTVAAGTEDVAFAAEVTLGDGTEFGGAPSIGNPGTGQLPLVFAGDAAAEGVAPEDAAQCFADTLDPAVVDGAMVLCLRGVIARTDKSAEVARAGGAAMLLGNTGDESLNSDAHVIPTLHVAQDATAAIGTYIEAADAPTAALSAARQEVAVAPDVAAFSARGPLADGDVLKPDILAPGVDVLAAYSPRIGGRDFDYLSGTSMSSPHMAGLSALVSQAHPDWSAAAVKSALMTTAYTTRTDGSPIAGGPLAYGSGHASPADALDPGLVYDAGFADWFAFLCGTGQLACPAEDAIDPSDLNQPNIAIGALAGSQTVTRTVTNVGPAGTYQVTVDAPEGVAVQVEPASLQLAEGEQATYEVTFETLEGAAIGETAFGTLAWSDGVRTASSQLVVTPVQLASPTQVNATGTDGEAAFEVGFGYSGEFTAAAHGMVPATRQAGTVVDDPSNDINTALANGTGITLEAVEVPAGSAFTRIALFDDATDGADDLDLYVFGPNGAFVGSSGSPTSAEQVDLPTPSAGTYTVVVHGWETDGPDAAYELFDWSIAADPAADDGSLAVDAPDAAVLGTTAQVTASWTGLEAGTRHLGAVSYADAGGVFGLTLVAVDTSG